MHTFRAKCKNINQKGILVSLLPSIKNDYLKAREELVNKVEGERDVDIRVKDVPRIWAIISER